MTPRAPDPPAVTMATLRGVVDRVTFHNPENGYSVLRFSVEGEKEPTVAVGYARDPVEGEFLLLVGEWRNDPRFGRQFAFSSAEAHVPTSLEGLERFLGSGLIPGVGPKMAARIVERFGEDTVEVLDKQPERLREVEGVGRKKLAQIREGWLLKRNVQEVMSFLQGHGITPRMAERILRQYGAATLTVVRQNPYRLARDMQGVGFRRADRIAREMGFASDSPERAEAAVLFLLGRGAEEGHCFGAFDELKRLGAELLGSAEVPVEEALVEEAIVRLYKESYVHCEVVERGGGLPAEAIYTPTLHRAEKFLAEKLLALNAKAGSLERAGLEASIDRFQQEFRFEFAPQQRQAVAMALRGGLSVITGGPGTGKTTIVRAILHILDANAVHVVLAAPTGRAAKRLEQSTRHTAKTIHRLLAFDPATGRFQHNASNPLKTDLLVVDEASMLDVPLAASLLEAVSPTTSVLFVGDVDQLPSVGPGDFLRDLIVSEVVPVTRLETVFRQAQRSLIVRNAHRINHGEFPAKPDPEKKSDFYFIERETPEEISETLVEVLLRRVPKKFGLDPRREVQVLVPMHKNSLGAGALNELLQAKLNAGAEQIYLGGGVTLAVGDKVLQTRNNYDLDVFNGDIGTIIDIDRKERLLRVDFEGRLKSYGYDIVDQLQLAYAISIHKSQGSEYKGVVVVLHPQHHVLLQRNLLYTAVTRGRKLVILLGSKRAIGTAIRNVGAMQRQTALAWRLRGEPEVVRAGPSATD